jgi:hypothetical protein
MEEKASFPIIHVYHQGKNMMEITQPKSIYDIQIIINVMVAEQEMKVIINKFRGDQEVGINERKNRLIEKIDENE